MDKLDEIVDTEPEERMEITENESSGFMLAIESSGLTVHACALYSPGNHMAQSISTCQ